MSTPVHKVESPVESNREMPGEAPCASPLISVVMPVRNEGQHIARTLRQLLDQDFDQARYEILVVDGESTDDTRQQVQAVAAGHPNVHLLTNPRRLSSSARNIGVQAARGELILIVDGHCEIKTPRLFLNLVEAFRVSGADCLGRPQPMETSRASTLQQAIALARSSWLGHHPDSFIYSDKPGFVPAHSVAVAYRRDVFAQAGHFDERFDACEDVEFNTRIDNAGLTCYFTPAIAVHYVPRASLAGLFKQLARYGRGRVRLACKHPGKRSVKAFVPALIVCGVLVGLLLSYAGANMTLICVTAITLYATTVVTVSAVLAGKIRRWPLMPLLPIVFVTIHAAGSWGVIREVFAPRRQACPLRDADARSSTQSGFVSLDAGKIQGFQE